MTEVYALADGRVSYVGTNNLSGRNIKLDHGEGWESYYIHLNNDNAGTDDGAATWSLALAPGIEECVEVVAGQLIGWVGDSGNAEGTTPHTHFELRKDGNPINAYEILVAAYDRAIELEILSRLDTTSHEVE
jgi:murein DD-endopeptidase MepM/ murein hydrolase activator NlpD